MPHESISDSESVGPESASTQSVLLFTKSMTDLTEAAVKADATVRVLARSISDKNTPIDDYELIKKLERLTAGTVQFVEFVKTSIDTVSGARRAELAPYCSPLRRPLLRIAEVVGKHSISDAALSKPMRRSIQDLYADAVKNFSILADEWKSAVDSDSDTLTKKIASDLLSTIRNNGQFESDALIEQTRQARDSVNEILQQSRQAAGETGAANLAIHYQNYARSEARTANILRGCTAAILLLVALGAYWLIRFEPTGPISVSAELARLAALLPLALLAGYFGREASRHRVAANWANQLRIQLLTLDAFTAPLPENERARQRSDFGKRVFVGVNEQTPVDIDNPTGTREIRSLVEALTKLTRGKQYP